MVSRKVVISTNLVALLLTGCSAKYQCELTKTGVCASVEDTYEAVVNGGRGAEGSPSVSSDKAEAQKSGVVLMDTKPVVPLRESEKVYRILVKEYVDESGFLVSSHYIYVPVKGSWKFGEKRDRRVFDTTDYDRMIKEYLTKKGKIKPQEKEEEDEDELDI